MDRVINRFCTLCFVRYKADIPFACKLVIAFRHHSGLAAIYKLAEDWME